MYKNISVKIFLFIFLFCKTAYSASFQEYKTENGTTIWHMENEHLPVISARIVFPIGASHEDPSQKGLTMLAASTMDEGAGDLPSELFRKELQDYNIKFAFNAQQDFFSLNMSFMNFDIDHAVRLGRMSLTSPRFDKEQINLIRNQIIATFDQQRTSPRGLLDRAARQSYYHNHPYRFSPRGNLDGLKNITQSDLKEFTARLGQNHAFIAVVGDINKSDAITFANNILSSLPITPKIATKKIPTYQKDIKKTESFIPLSTPQTHILFQKTGFRRHDPDFIPAIVASHILGGGGFGSRLMQVLREEHGLTYGVSSYIASGTYASRFHISYATDNKNVDQSIDLVRKTVDEYLKDGITEDTLNAAIRYLKGYYPIQFNTNEQLAFLAQSLWEDNLSVDYPQKRNALLDSLTVEQVKKAAQKLTTPPYEIFAVGGKNAPNEFNIIKKEDIIF